MPDMTALAAAWSSFQTAFKIGQTLTNSYKRLKEIEVQAQLVDLMEALTETRVQLNAARNENIELLEKLEEAGKKLKSKEELEYQESDRLYYRSPPIDGKPNGPFCPHCYESQDKIISLGPMPEPFRDSGEKYVCPECDAGY